MRLWCAAGALVVLASFASAGVLFSASGFESYALGNLPGQDGWINDTVDLDPLDGFTFDQPTVVSDPTGFGMGKVIKLDAPDGVASQGWTGAARPSGPSALPIVTIEWDQYRDDFGDNLWTADDVSFNGWWAIQWDLNGSAFPQFFDGPALPLLASFWQHVKYTFNFTANTVTLDVMGATSTVPMGAYTNIRGIVFELEGTAVEAVGDGPVYIDNVVITETPEPAALALLALGLVLRRR